MSPNRKADLQRKLAMAPIPKPPAGLAERIKSEIPQHLLVDARKERERLSRSIAFNLRVAASIILLVGSVYLALRVLSTAEIERTHMEAPANVVVAKKAPAPAAAPARVAEAAPPPVELRKTLPAPKPETKREKARAGEEVAGGVAGGVVGGVVGGMRAPAMPAVAPPPPPAAPPIATAEAADTAAAPRTAAKAAGGLMSEANAAPLALVPAKLFDIVIARGGVILQGPMVIQRFAQPDPPPHAVRVESEAAKFGGRTLLRFSVDTPYVAHPAGGSWPPVGADATLDIDFDDSAVGERRALSGVSHAAENALPSAASVTALYEVELKPDISRRATIATATLRYRSVADGKEHVVTRKLRASDVRAWDDASKRMKGASLGAALVYGFEPAETIAEKARAAGFDELADLAEKR